MDRQKKRIDKRYKKEKSLKEKKLFDLKLRDQRKKKNFPINCDILLFILIIGARVSFILKFGEKLTTRRMNKS